VFGATVKRGFYTYSSPLTNFRLPDAHYTFPLYAAKKGRN
jgi:hypothetical protein